MSFRAELRGVANLRKRLQKIGRGVGAAADRAAMETALRVHGDAVDAIRAPTSGRTYRRGAGQNLSPVHVASAPGEAPNTDTGNLIGSMQADRQETGGHGVRWVVVARAPYANFLEWGTRDMAPRPFLVPALRQNALYFSRRLQRHISDITGGPQ